MPTKKKNRGTQAKKKTTSSPKSKRPSQRAEQEGTDIINLILKDHTPLKKLIKVMKDSDKEFSERHAAFEEFCPLLITHAKAEELVLYTHLKKDSEMRTEALEGDVEHQLADQMVEEAQRTNDEDLWSAKVKVLAELVEHHIKEEEGELLPEFKKDSDKKVREDLGEEFLRMKENINENGTEKNPSLLPEDVDEETVARH